MAKSLDSQFADWVAQQPADLKYAYGDICGCALYRFLIDAGYPVRAVAGHWWRDTDNENHPLSDTLRTALVRLPNTYGALAERLAA